jgi:AcrR family transcriptional regulator
MNARSRHVADDTDARRAEMTTRILDEAERLFRHYGYSKTTVADIARELGMSPANVYRFFASKTKIHEALAERMLVAREVALQAIATRPLSASERLRTYVIQEYHATVTQMLDESKVHEMVTVALEEHWEVIDRHLRRMSDIVSRIIADGMRDGEFVMGDPKKAALAFQSCVISACHPIVVAQCRMLKDRVSPDDLVDFVLRALKA